MSASLDWRRTEGEEWTITLETDDGMKIRLENGGARLILNGETSVDDGIGEYPDIYRTFVDLIDERRSLVDVAPLRLVADCLLVGRRSASKPSTADGATWPDGHYHIGPHSKSRVARLEETLREQQVAQVTTDELIQADEAFSGNGLLFDLLT